MKPLFLTVNGLLALLIVAACTAIPTKDNPAGYTRSFVQDAIRFYEKNGREALIDRYSSPASVDGQWYLFVIDENNRVLAHYNPERLGEDNLTFTDSTGFAVGEVVAATTGQGQWLTYLNVNPETGEEARKHTWAIRHDGLIFGSGWYE